MTKNRISAWLWAPLIALQFLTRIPIRFVPDSAYDDGGRERSFVFYPVVGIVVGLAGYGTFTLAHRLHVPSTACAILTVIVTAAVTGAFHEDGFADVADGLGPHDREAALKAMRDSRLGSFGVIALWALLSLKVTALTSIAPENAGKAIIAAHILSRWSPLPMSKLMSDAQPTTGLGARMAASITWMSIVLATIIGGAATYLLLGSTAAVRGAVGAVVVMVLSGLLYRAKFGGITGDCLGATNQIIEVVTLLLFCTIG